MRRALIPIGYAVAGLALAVGLTAGGYAIAGRDLSEPVRVVRPTQELVRQVAPAAATASPDDSPSPDDEASPDDRGGDRGRNNSGSGSDDSDSGSDNSGSGSSNSGSGSGDD